MGIKAKEGVGRRALVRQANKAKRRDEKKARKGGKSKNIKTKGGRRRRR